MEDNIGGRMRDNRLYPEKRAHNTRWHKYGERAAGFNTLTHILMVHVSISINSISWAKKLNGICIYNVSDVGQCAAHCSYRSYWSGGWCWHHFLCYSEPGTLHGNCPTFLRRVTTGDCKRVQQECIVISAWDHVSETTRYWLNCSIQWSCYVPMIHGCCVWMESLISPLMGQTV